MKKSYLFIDFDDCIVDSLPVVVDILNKKYHTSFKPIDVHKWDMTDCWGELTNDELNWAFECDEFWNNIEFKQDTFYTLQSLQHAYEICIVSKGTKENLARKKDWVSKHLNYNGVRCRFLPIELGHSKGEVPMPPRSVMIDDNERYLDETDATVKILYESYKNREWNKHWDGISTDNWLDLNLTLTIQAALMNGKIQNDDTNNYDKRSDI